MANRFLRPLLSGAVAPAALFLTGRERRWGPVKAEVLDNKAFSQLKCLKNEAVTSNTRKIVLQLPHPDDRWTPKGPIANVVVGLPPQAPEPGSDKPKQVAKPYNPLCVEEQGSVTLLVKKYEGAQVGGQLHSLKVGETIAVKRGWQQWELEKGKCSHYGMVAGGTGITPLIQAAQYVLKHDSQAKVTLISANKTPQDVLLHGELAALEKAYPGRFTVQHHVDSAAGTQITPELLKKVLPAAGPGVFVMVCGPMGMVKDVAGPKAPDFSQGELGGFLKDLGYSQVHVFKV